MLQIAYVYIIYICEFEIEYGYEFKRKNEMEKT
jgi:hypothetical protein